MSKKQNKYNSIKVRLDSVNKSFSKIEFFSGENELLIPVAERVSEISKAFKDLQNSAERLVLNIRSARCSVSDPEDVNNTIVDVFKVDIDYDEESGITSIRMPQLLATRNELTKNEAYGSDNLVNIIYIRESLTAAILKYREAVNGQLPHYDDCVVVYINHFDDTVAKEQQRVDSDNYEVRSATNVLSTFFLVDDAPQYCDFFITSKADNKKFTAIYIVPRSRFSDFFSREISGKS